jgi:hypothetical protein
MKSLKVTLPILAFFYAILTANGEEPKQTNEIESSVNQFLEKENRALREIIANAVKRKSFLIYENGKVTRIKINESTAVKLNSYLKLVSPLDDRVISLNSDLREAQSKNRDYDSQIANLNDQLALKDRAIEDISRRLETSEEDRDFLLKDRDRLIADKAELKKQFKDIVAIRKKVQQLQVELMASKKLEWFRQGIYGSAGEKGGARLATLQKGGAVNPDLKVEVKRDETVKATNVEGDEPEEGESQIKTKGIEIKTPDKIILLDSDSWKPMRNEFEWARNYSAKSKSKGQVYETVLTIYLLPMSADRKSGKLISSNEYIEIFQVRPGTVTVQLRVDKGKYWVLTRDTYNVNTPASKVELDTLVYNMVYKEIQTKVDSNRFFIRNSL